MWISNEGNFLRWCWKGHAQKDKEHYFELKIYQILVLLLSEKGPKLLGMNRPPPRPSFIIRVVNTWSSLVLRASPWVECAPFQFLPLQYNHICHNHTTSPYGFLCGSAGLLCSMFWNHILHIWRQNIPGSYALSILLFYILWSFGLLWSRTLSSQSCPLLWNIAIHAAEKMTERMIWMYSQPSDIWTCNTCFSCVSSVTPNPGTQNHTCHTQN